MARYRPEHPRSFELYAVRGAVVADVTDLLLGNSGAADTTRLRCTVVDLQPADLGYYADLGIAAGKCGKLWFHAIRYTDPGLLQRATRDAAHHCLPNVVRGYHLGAPSGQIIKAPLRRPTSSLCCSLRLVWLRPSRQQRPLPRMRDADHF